MLLVCSLFGQLLVLSIVLLPIFPMYDMSMQSICIAIVRTFETCQQQQPLLTAPENLFTGDRQIDIQFN